MVLQLTIKKDEFKFWILFKRKKKLNKNKSMKQSRKYKGKQYKRPSSRHLRDHIKTSSIQRFLLYRSFLKSH